MRVIRGNHGKAAAVYTVTDARPPMSEDIDYRQRRYLISMGVRTICFVLTVVIAMAAPGPLKGLALVSLTGAIVLPYIAVIFANGGREPDSRARFEPYEPQSRGQRSISGRHSQIDR